MAGSVAPPQPPRAAAQAAEARPSAENAERRKPERAATAAQASETRGADGLEHDDVDALPLGVVIADCGMQITSVNEGFSAITGYSASEAVGRNCRFLQGPDTDRRAVAAMSEALRARRAIRLALLNYRKDGTPFWNLLYLAPLFDERGAVRSYIGVQMYRRAEFVDRPLVLLKWSSRPLPGEEHKTKEAIADGRSDGASDGEPARRPAAEAVTFVAETQLPTLFGVFRTRAYATASGGELVCMVVGDVAGREDVAVRVHDQCLTSEVFGSLKCDCKLQLDWAQRFVQRHGGVVVYLMQEGRGIGLANKIKAYSVQEHGYDTVDSNRILGFPDDARHYECVPSVLADLGVRSVRLITNNPRKIEALRSLGVAVSGRVHVELHESDVAEPYLQAKRARMGHMLEH